LKDGKSVFESSRGFLLIEFAVSMAVFVLVVFSIFSLQTLISSMNFITHRNINFLSKAKNCLEINSVQQIEPNDFKDALEKRYKSMKFRIAYNPEAKELLGKVTNFEDIFVSSKLVTTKSLEHQKCNNKFSIIGIDRRS
jgi:hypothetical protein